MASYNGLEYRYDCSGIQICAYNGSATYVTIPSQINGSPVTSIGTYAFNGCSALTSINIPDSVASIGDNAFNGCSALTSINIPDSVTSIGNSTFSYCSTLTSINIPDSVTSIGNSTFSYCSTLTSINIPNSVTSIGDNAFNGCTSLTSINLPDSVTSIGDNAFNGCSALTSINLPDSVTSIGDNAFSYCSTLTSIIIPGSVTSIGNDAFSECSKLKNILIHAFNIYTDKDAFDNCGSLKITRYKFSSRFFPKNKDLINVELPQLIEPITKLLNSIQRVKSLPLNNAELFKSVRKLEALFESKGYSSEFDTAATKILNDIETEYNRQYQIMSNSTLPAGISAKISRLENVPSISAELLALIKKVKDLSARDYSPELNDYVTKVLADIETEYNRQQEKNYVINLIALVESVSSKQITNTPQYVQKFANEVADFVSNINATIEALKMKKQNRLSEQKCENESRINAELEVLKASLKE